MRRQRSRLAFMAGVGLLLLATVSGCATSGSQADEDLARRKASSHFNLAADHAENGRLELALRELLAAQRLNPRNPRVEHALGMAYLRKGRQVEAEQHMLSALEIAPGYQEARYNLSTLYLSQGRFQECIHHSQLLFDDATFTAPWRALTNWGWAAYQLGDPVQARAHLEHAQDYNPRYWPTQLNLGILEQEEGNRVEAIRAFGVVLELRPTDSAAAEANYRLAEIHVSMGQRVEAMGYLRTAVVKAPDDPWGKKSEAFLKRLR
ncbi:MAG: tetratricopeptide repeat protein [Deltaproteobacteria bacterium]|nr:tetratricopeptide repeat protein [Deltaproteobacteria bacterium]